MKLLQQFWVPRNGGVYYLRGGVFCPVDVHAANFLEQHIRITIEVADHASQDHQPQTPTDLAQEQGDSSVVHEDQRDHGCGYPR